MSNQPANRQVTSSKPPKLGEFTLRLMLSKEDADVILGDFQEEFQRMTKNSGKSKAQLWYWREVFKSMPALLILFNKQLAGGNNMEKLRLLQQNNRPVAIGLVLIVPAMILVFGGLLQSLAGVSQFNEAVNFDLFIFHPTVILGGLALAFGLNLISVASLRFQGGKLIGTIQVKDRLWSLALIGAIGGMVGVIFIYLLAENFQIFAGL